MIILFSNTNKGGAWVRLREFEKYLIKNNCNYKVITYKDKLKHHSINHLLIPRNKLTNNILIFNILSIKYIVKYVFDSKNETIFLSFLGFSGFAACLISKLSPKIKFYTFLRGVEYKQFFLRHARKTITIRLIGYLFLLVQKYQCNLSKGIIVQSNYGKHQLIKQGVYIQKKFLILPNNTNSINIQNKKKKLATNDLLDANNFYKVGYIGNIDIKVKGIDRFLILTEKLIKDFEKRNIKKPLIYIAGNGMDVDYVIKFIEDSKYKEQYIFEGYKENSLEFIKSLDLLIVPSRSDAFPNVIIEALSVNTITIASNTDGIPEILPENFLFDFNDYESLVNRIREILLSNAVNIEYHKLLKNSKHKLCFNWPEVLMMFINEKYR